MATATGTRTSARTGARIDPRIRQRRAEVARRQGRRRLRLLLALLAAGALLGLALVVLHSGLFSARRITVVGSVHTPTSEIVDVAGLDGQPPLIDIGPSATTRLEALPWVSRASVDVEWPDAVRITVVERTPVAAVEDGTTWALVDRTGQVLADDTTAPPGLPQLVGGRSPGAPGTRLGGASAALTVAASVPPAFAAQVAQVDQVAGGQVELHLTTPLTVDLGTPAQLHRKYEDVAAILAGAALASGDVIDVTAPTAPTVRAPAGSAASATA